MKTAYIDYCRNMFGPLNDECRKRLEAVLRNPTARTWDNAYSLIVGADGFMTLWQAWIAVDPLAPLTGKLTDQHGRVIEGWSRIPDQLTLYRALRYATRRTS
jgi:hypothetical protein